MPSSNVCWGIEVGAGAIKALKLEAGSAGEVRVLDYAVLPHKKVLSTPDLDQSDALRVALGTFASQFEIGKASVAVSVPGHSAFARFAKLPPVEPKKVPDIVKFEAVQQIPFPIDQVEWDYQTFQSPDSPDIEVGIFAITRERIMERLAMYEDVGIVPDYVTLSPVAAYNALAYDLQFTEKTPGTIILDVGTTSTDLIVAEAGRVWIRTFPIGGHHFTEALVNAFQLSYPKAEKLKREADSSKHARHIFQALRPVFGDLAQDVQRSIGYYTSLHKEAELVRLIGLGSTFRLPGLRKYLKQQLGLDVYRMEQFKRLSLDGPRAGEFQAGTLNLATAYGLALQGLGMATLEANLMPVQVIKAAMWKRKVPWFGVAAGVAVAAGGAMFIRPFLDDTESANNPESPIVAQVLSTGNRLKSEAQELTVPTLSNTAASDVMALLENREHYARILDDLGQLADEVRRKAESWPGGQGATFEITGFTTTFEAPEAGPDGAALDPSQPGGQARIRVTASVSTTIPDARRFALQVIDEWFRRHARRNGVPYEIVTARESAANFVTRTVEAEGASASGGPQTPPRATIVGGPQPGRGGRNLPGAPIAVGGAGSEAGARQTGPAPDPSAGAAIETLNRSAPLPEEPKPQPGTQITTFDITWDVVLTPQAAPAGGAS